MKWVTAMGEHRATIKIEFEIYGEKDKVDMWINWSPDGQIQGLDDRVAEWFVAHYEKARSVYDDRVYESEEEQREAENRRRDLAELDRLLKKYPGAKP